jgi:hypothetical protein
MIGRFIHILRHSFNQKKTTNLLKYLLLFDLVFVLGHIMVVLFNKHEFKAFLLDTQELGYPEYFQYFKYIMVLAVTSYLVVIKKKFAYLPFIGLFLFLLIDDVFQIHGRASWFFMFRLKLPAVLFGQLVYLALIGGIGAIVTYMFYRKANLATKNTFKDILLLLALFLFFGIGVDIIHSLLIHIGKIVPFLTLVEEGGEMITLSILVWYFYFLALCKTKNRIFLYELLLTKWHLKIH